jgi:uncharacterized damage-inducible protein DinB
MKEQLQFLAEYNRKTNLELLAILEREDPTSLYRSTGAYYKSILGTVSHVLFTDIVWLGRMVSHDESLAAAVGALPAADSPDVVDRIWRDLAAFRATRQVADDCLARLVAAVPEDRLTEILHYNNLKGEPQAKPWWVILLHLFNHATHHRGQVATLLDQAGVTNDYSGLVTKFE